MLLFETLSQPLIFVITLAIGFASGLLVDARNYIHFLCNKNKIVGLVLDIIVSFLCSLQEPLISSKDPIDFTTLLSNNAFASLIFEFTTLYW